MDNLEIHKFGNDPLRLMAGNFMAITSDLANRALLFEHIFDTLQDGIFVVDRDLSIVRANRWIQLKYESAGPLIGQKCHRVFHGQAVACPECPCWPSTSADRAAPKIIPYPSAQKPEAWLELNVQRLEDGNGRCIGAIGHLKDITERKRYENLLMDEVVRRQLLVDVQLAVNDFGYGEARSVPVNPEDFRT